MANPVDHDAIHPSDGGHSNLLAPSYRTEQSGAAAFETTCMAIRGWPRCCAWRPRALLQRHPCWCRHATPHARMELPPLSQSPDRHDKTIGICVLLSFCDWHPIGRLNRSTDQIMLACQPRLRITAKTWHMTNLRVLFPMVLLV